MTEVILSARDLERSFRLGGRQIRVLTRVDLDVRTGELLAIRGKSGAGKSTLLHVLGLLDRPSAGSVSIKGRDLARASESVRNRVRARELGFVFQFYYLLPEFDAVENVVMPALIAGPAGRRHGRRSVLRSRAIELLGRVGLGHRLDHRPSQLSGGERQRVAIARALMNEPQVMFCDEPTGNLDSTTANGIHELLRELHGALGQTIVLVTHEPTTAGIADRVITMEDGVLDGRLVPAPSDQGVAGVEP